MAVLDTVTAASSKFLENARATKFTKRLSTMKGVPVELVRSPTAARAVYDPAAALPLGSDTEQENAWGLGPWLDFAADERFDGSGVIAATSSLGVEELGLVDASWEALSPFYFDWSKLGERLEMLDAPGLFAVAEDLITELSRSWEPLGDGTGCN